MKIPTGERRNVGPQDQRAKEGLLRGQLILCWTACNPSPGTSRGRPEQPPPMWDGAYRQLM